MAFIYIVLTPRLADKGSIPGLEWAGATAMVLAAGLTLMLGAYLHFTERRMDILPQDWEEAEVEDGTGVYGFFAAASIWPFAMSMGIAVLGIGIAFMNYWMIILGAIVLIWATVMLNVQYGMPREKH